MQIPCDVRACIDALENAGFAAYLVGGCVRDAYLGLTPNDYDLTTSALPEQTEAVFAGYRLVLAGKKHGTVGVVTDSGVVEITTFRTEGGYEDSRHPQWVKFVPDIESDLARRDFTVNAMAYSPTRGFADPFGGRADLDAGILRAVGDPARRFEEDALRILRGIRFAAKFNLQIDPQTESAMLRQLPRMEDLAKERIFEELCRFLQRADVAHLTRFAPVLTAVIPELAPTVGFDQRSPHHAYDIYTHTAYVVSSVPADLILRWTALLHDIGKPAAFTTDETGRGHFYGHAKISAEMADDILRRLKAPTALREQVVVLIGQHMVKPEADKLFLRRRLSRLGEEIFLRLMLLQEADMGSKGTDESVGDPLFFNIRRIVTQLLEENACLSLKDLAVNGNDMMALGITGKAIGAALKRLLELVIDEKLPNERNALLEEAKRANEIAN